MRKPVTKATISAELKHKISQSLLMFTGDWRGEDLLQNPAPRI